MARRLRSRVGRRIRWVRLGTSGVIAAVVLAAAACGDVTPAESRPSPSLQQVGFYQERVERDPQDFFSYTRLAMAFVERGRETGDVRYFEDAETALRASLAILPRGNYAAKAQLATILNTKHQFAQALPVADEAIAEKPGAALAYGARGDALMELGRVTEAEGAYRRMAELEPGLSAFSRLARIEMFKGNYEAAKDLWLQALQSAQRSSPVNLAWVELQLGHMHLDVGDRPAARDYLEASLATLPGYLHALAGLGRWYATAGDYPKAIAFYKQALSKVEPPEYVIALGDAYSGLGWEAEARQAYARVDGLYAYYAEHGIDVNLQLAQFGADHGDSRRAVEHGRLAWEARQDAPAADALAWALYRAGDHQAAMSFSTKALDLGAGDSLSLYHAGMIARAVGDTTAAIEHLRRALAINPRFSVLQAPIAQQALTELETMSA
jgi:tetratricopeptide (TPR) repeat protein